MSSILVECQASTPLLTATTKVPEYDDLIGKRFEYGGRGPDKFDCYGLLIELHRRMGVSIPDVASASDQAEIAHKIIHNMDIWGLTSMAPGATITFRIGRYVSHVGFMVSHSDFLHVWEGGRIGVARENIMSWQHRVAGCWKYKNNK